MKEMLKWIDSQSQLAMQAELAFAEAIDRKATAFFNLLLASAGGGLAWSFAIWKDGPAGVELVATLAATAWLFGVAALVLLKVLSTSDFYAPGYDAQPSADKLFSVEADDDQWMRWMMDHRQLAIDHNRRRNQAAGRWLNRCQWLAVMAPAIVISVTGAAAY